MLCYLTVNLLLRRPADAPPAGQPVLSQTQRAAGPQADGGSRVTERSEGRVFLVQLPSFLEV